MANKVNHKRSAVAGKVPVAADLELGQLAINTTDGKLYTKKGDNTIAELSISAAERTKLGGLNKVASPTDTTADRLLTTDYLDIGKLTRRSGRKPPAC